jgi:predicted small secreted protein
MNKLKKKYSLVVIFVLSAIVLSGCAGVREACKGVAGVSTKVLEDTREEGLNKVIGYDLITCHNRIRSILKAAGAYIYTDDLNNDMLAIYVSEEDTTPVGIFLTERSARSTFVEVSSPSTYAKEKIAKLLFDTLTKELNEASKKGQANVTQTKEIN